jgi:hypothetical protein
MYEILFTNPRLEKSIAIGFYAAGIPKSHKTEDVKVLHNVAKLLFGKNYKCDGNKYVYTGNYFEDRSPENGTLTIEYGCYLSYLFISVPETNTLVKTQDDDNLERV